MLPRGCDRLLELIGQSDVPDTNSGPLGALGSEMAPLECVLGVGAGLPLWLGCRGERSRASGCVLGGTQQDMLEPVAQEVRIWG